MRQLILVAKNNEKSILYYVLNLKNKEDKFVLDINDKDANGRTALIAAVQSGSIEMVEHLLSNYKERGIYINAVDKKGKTAIMHVVDLLYGQKGAEIVRLLNKRKCRPLYKNKRRRNSF